MSYAEYHDPTFAIIWVCDCPLCGNRHFGVTSSEVWHYDGSCPSYNTMVTGWGIVAYVNKFLHDLIPLAIADVNVISELAYLYHLLHERVEETRKGRKKFMEEFLGNY